MLILCTTALCMTWVNIGLGEAARYRDPENVWLARHFYKWVCVWALTTFLIWSLS